MNSKETGAMIKKMLIIFSCICVAVTARSQIALEKTYTGTAEIADFDNLGYKYFTTDYINNAVSLYNFDHSFLKTIKINVPADQSLYDVAYVSTHLFNSDALIEMLVMTYKYITQTDTSGYYVYNTQVVNENGTLLAEIPGGAYASLFYGTNKVNKLIVYVYDFSISEYIQQTKIYSVTGTSVGLNENPGDIQLPFPNPTTDIVNLPVPSPSAYGNAQLMVRDMMGREISRKNLDRNETIIPYQTKGLSAGTYIYSIETAGRVLPAGKFIVR